MIANGYHPLLRRISSLFNWRFCSLYAKAFFSVVGLVIIITYIALPRTNEYPGTPPSQHKRTILMWTRVFGEEKDYLSDCPWRNRCSLTYDRSLFKDAHAVVFHPDDMWYLAPLPSHHAFPQQKFVFYSMETPVMMPWTMWKMPRHFFQWTMTHLNSSHIPSPYGEPWVPPSLATARGLTPENISLDVQEIMREKSIKGIFWLVSNCKTQSQRERAVDALSKYIRVDIAGKCATKSALRKACPKGSTCEEVYRRYYFYIAAENTLCTDYISEKYWQRYHLPLVPIVMRRKIYEKHIPSTSFIAMDDFSTVAQMGEYLNRLMDNPTEYLKYFEWRKEGWARERVGGPNVHIGPCRLCAKLHDDSFVEKAATIEDIGQWYLSESKCEEGDKFVDEWTSS